MALLKSVKILKSTLLLWGLLMVGLILSVCLRSSSYLRGADAKNYYQLFQGYQSVNSIPEYFIKTAWTGSFGFIALNVIIAQFTQNPMLYMFITTLLIISLLIYSFSKFFSFREKPLYILSILALISCSSFYFYAINIIRQGFMAGFLVLCLYYLIQKRYWLTGFYFVLGTLFHYSMLLVLPAILAYRFFPRIKQTPLMFYPAILLFSMIQPTVIIKLLDILQLSFFAYKVKRYLVSSLSQPNVLLKVMIIFLLLHIFYLAKKHSKDRLFTELYYISCLIFAEALLFFNIAGLMNRFLLFISILLPILFVRAIHCVKQKYIYYVAVLLGTILYLVVILQHPSVQEQFFARAP